ncbi:hypothetical protein [Acanthopleuribacter pedis]|uniref:Uncharacterized protein n=1 Tax=Acanthopleuribacter pedis TaxID=442870 RepID=A0A8J7QGS5_9BACT|nr:hypothetical protein [Acanthopleuribacter pedis]MBO1322050.1 hypothetical protein [Acanthopleuribacter pedis]
MKRNGRRRILLDGSGVVTNKVHLVVSHGEIGKRNPAGNGPASIITNPNGEVRRIYERREQIAHVSAKKAVAGSTAKKVSLPRQKATKQTYKNQTLAKKEQKQPTFSRAMTRAVQALLYI